MRQIYDITPFSALDFPGKLSAIVWFAGCNLRCDYCYNPHIVFSKGAISTQEALHFLKSRVALLDGVVISGGEPTGFGGLQAFCEQVKSLGFLIKLDTNGTNPDVVLSLLDNHLLDYVSLDFKSTSEKWRKIAKGSSFEAFSKSLALLLASKIDFEVRTTLHPDLLDNEDLKNMRNFLRANGYKGEYFVQAYRHGETLGVIKEPCFGWERKFVLDDISWR